MIASIRAVGATDAPSPGGPMMTWNREPRPVRAARRNVISALALTLAAWAGPATPAEAGAMKGRPSVRVKASVQQRWDSYWRKALRLQTMNVKFPGKPPRNVLALAADGSVAETPFLEYMRWRRGLNPKQFDGNHAEIARILRRPKPIPVPILPPVPSPTPTTPGTRPVPIEPPDYVPVSPGFVNPPQVPEPSAGLVALGLAGAGFVARRWVRRAP